MTIHEQLDALDAAAQAAIDAQSQAMTHCTAYGDLFGALIDYQEAQFSGNPFRRWRAGRHLRSVFGRLHRTGATRAIFDALNDAYSRANARSAQALRDYRAVVQAVRQ